MYQTVLVSANATMGSINMKKTMETFAQQISDAINNMVKQGYTYVETSTQIASTTFMAVIIFKK
ncbi:MAG: hypothetical protein LBM87_04450 [Ruminococcus sp.]|jgi:hypothetical protein|nr:hypothetical protein [Ruminococcus sp.]